MTDRLKRLLRPQTIAVFGRAWAEAVVHQSSRMGFSGEIWPVHPTLDEIAGRPCYRSVQSLPRAPDASFVGINREATIGVIRELAEAGAGGATCFASGFAEVGPSGRVLQERLIEAAGRMPVLGPNCYGYINYVDGALLWPDLHGGRKVSKGVAIIAQSSNISVNVTMNRRALDLAYVLALGNQAVVGLPEVIEALSEDPRVTALGLYIEGIQDVARFAEASLNAFRKGKPIVALQVGRSERSAAMARSHTGSMAGSDAVADALLRRLGIARVESLPALLESLKLLDVVGPLPDRTLVSMSCSGGEASIMADSARGRDLSLVEFTPEHQAAIRATVNPLVHVSNPFDYHTFDWGDREKLSRTFAETLVGPQAITALVLDYPKDELGSAETWDAAADALADAVAVTGKRAAVIATLPECLPERRAWAIRGAGMAPLAGVEDALTAIECSAFIGRARPSPITQSNLVEGEARTFDEAAAKTKLAAAGVPVPFGRLCRTAAEAVEASAGRGPVAMKAVGIHILHKTERGAVRLGLRDPGAIAAAFGDLIGLGDAVLVEDMVQNGVGELIVGFVRDPVVGLHMVIGTGGTQAELLQDTAVLLLPSSRDSVEQAIRSLRLSPLLTGWRGSPPADIEAAADAIVAAQSFALEHASRIEELEINPLILCRAGEGAHAADALLIMRDRNEQGTLS